MNTSIEKSPMVPVLYRVQRVRQETTDTFTLELVEFRSNGGFSFAPGQFNMLYIYGVGEIPISISGDPSKTHAIVHTTRAVGAVSKAMRKLRKGDTLGVRGPFGTPWPVDRAEGHDVVFVAGGIGLPPLRPALYRILSHREKYGKVVLLYGARTPADILFRAELERWRARLDVDVFVTVDRAERSWKGNVGVVINLIPKAPFDPGRTFAMVVGPEIMMRFTILELLKRGIPEENVYLSMERNMKCGIGLCGHCQYREMFVCRDGPVFAYPRIKDLLTKWEI